MRHGGWLAAALGSLALLLADCGGTPSPTALSGRACLARLDKHEIDYRPVEPPSSNARCQIDTAVRISRVEVGFDRPVTVSCALASRLDDFEREIVQPLAKEELGRRIVRINHLGGFSCRGVNGGQSRLSQHALGRAIDIAGFRLSDGSTISVEHDWAEPGPKRDFLHRLARRACGYFSVVLTPDSDGNHYNHLHFDIGPDRLCSA